MIELDHFPAQFGELKARPQDVEHISGLATNQQHDGGRVVGELVGRERGVPTDDEAVTRLYGGSVVISSEPGPIDHVAGERYRVLQILRRKVARSHGALDLGQDAGRLAPRVKDLAG